MINYLTITTVEGVRTLDILNTSAENIEAQIAKAQGVRNIKGEAFQKVDVSVVKSSHTSEYGESVEAKIAYAIARRSRWTLYSDSGEVIGSGSGDWKSWYVKSPLVDNTVLARFTLAELEELRVQV